MKKLKMKKEMKKPKNGMMDGPGMKKKMKKMDMMKEVFGYK